ncbi:tetraspanin-1-like [Chanos chanos]|uniref:Tetraspanin n=1 Tax=Chanos chanos TaxID=29144 RepID=A0A6J2VS44_CHACN|nr:tetraspanin-1-like [Chanos chanos]
MCCKGCCRGLLKAVMFSFNFLVCLAGFVVLGVGVWLVVDSESLFGILEHLEAAPPEISQLVYIGYPLVGVGTVLVIIGFLGCCGVIMESKCMLLTFFIIMLLLFLVELVVAIIAGLFLPLTGSLFAQIEDNAVQGIKTNYGVNDAFTATWDNTMTNLRCCGYNNYTDFDGSPFSMNGTYPSQCCAGVELCNEDVAALSDVRGCFPALVTFIEDNAVIFGAVALGVAVLEIAAMIASMIVYKGIRN